MSAPAAEETSRSGSLLRRAGQLLPVVVCMVASSLTLRGFTIDDDFILVRFAERFLAGEGLTFNDDTSVNAVTSVLSLFAMIVAGWLGFDPLTGARILSLAGLLLIGTAVATLARRMGVGPLWSAVPAGALLLAAPLAVWSSSAVGSVFLAGLLAWAVLDVLDNRPRVGVFLAAACWVRLDAAVLVIGVFAGWMLLHRARARALPAAIGCAASLLGLLVWQRLTFGVWFSNVASVKFRFDVSQVPAGVRYTGGFLLVMLPVLFAGVVFASRPLLVRLTALVRADVASPAAPSTSASPSDGQGSDGPKPASSEEGSDWTIAASSGSHRLRAAALLLLPATLYAGYVTFVGGDWMPAHRLLAPVFVLLTMAVVVLAGQHRPTSRLTGPLLLVALVATVVLSFDGATRARVESSAQWLRECRQASAAVDALAAPTDRPPLLAVEPAGCLPALTGLPTLDMVGLLDPVVASTPTSGRVLDWSSWLRRYQESSSPSATDLLVGHARGNGDYVWTARPDLLVPCSPADPTGRGCFASWAQIEAGHDIDSSFQLLPVTSGPSALWHLWVRFDGGPLGVQHRDGLLSVPGHLLLGAPSALTLSESATLEGVIPTGSLYPLGWSRLLGSGSWRFEGLPDGVEFLWSAACASVSTDVLVRPLGCDADLLLRSSSGAVFDVAATTVTLLAGSN